MKRFAPALVVAAALCAAVATSASAAGPISVPGCGNVVLDQANVLTPAEEARVEDQATRLARTVGAAVYVQTLTKDPAANLDTFVAEEGQGCDAWQTPAGLRTNLIVLVVSMDRQAGVFPTDEFKPALDGQYSTVIADMGPFFRERDFAGGLIKGLKDVQQLIVDYQHPAKAPTQTVIKEPSKPVDLTWLWILLTVLGGGGALVGLGYGGVALRRRERERVAAQQQTRKLKSAVTDKVFALSTADDDLDRSYEIVKPQLGAAEQAELDQLKATADQALSKATDGWSELSTPDKDPEKRLSKDEYQAVAAALTQVGEDTDAALAAVKAAQDKADQLGKLMADLPGEIAKVGEALEAVKPAIAETQKQGYKTAQAEQELTSAAAARDAAQQALAAKSVEQANHALSMAGDLVRQAQAWLKALPALKSGLDKGAKDVLDRIGEAKSLVAKTKPVFDQMHDDYAASCWEPVKGNGSEAEIQIQQAEAAHESAVKAATMDEQDWDGSQQALDHANSSLDQVTTLCGAITSLKDTLDKAKASAAGLVQHAADEIEKAQAFVQANDDDLPEDLERDLDGAREQVKAALAELKQDKPDYLVATKAAQAAAEVADRVLAEARDDKAKLDSLRQQAESAERTAESAVQAAESYIQSHSSDVESAAKSQLASAKRDLQEAQAVTVAVKSPETADRDQTEALTSKVGAFKDAEQAANDALAKARRDVEDAEEERRAAERRRQQSYQSNQLATGIALGSMMHSGGGGGFGGGSGGISIGGGGSFGGGSGGW